MFLAKIRNNSSSPTSVDKSRQNIVSCKWPNTTFQRVSVVIAKIIEIISLEAEPLYCILLKIITRKIFGTLLFRIFQVFIDNVILISSKSVSYQTTLTKVLVHLWDFSDCLISLVYSSSTIEFYWILWGHFPIVSQIQTQCFNY